MKILTKDDILTADDLKRELVEVPEWGAAVYVRVLTGTERDSFERACLDTDSGGSIENVRGKISVRAIVDAAGNRLFEDDDADALGAKSAAALDRVYDAVQRLNRISKSDVAELSKAP